MNSKLPVDALSMPQASKKIKMPRAAILRYARKLDIPLYQGFNFRNQDVWYIDENGLRLIRAYFDENYKDTPLHSKYENGNY